MNKRDELFDNLRNQHILKNDSAHGVSFIVMSNFSTTDEYCLPPDDEQ